MWLHENPRLNLSTLLPILHPQLLWVPSDLFSHLILVWLINSLGLESHSSEPDSTGHKILGLGYEGNLALPVTPLIELI